MYFGAGSKAFLIMQLTLLVIFEVIKQVGAIWMTYWANDKFGWTADMKGDEDKVFIQPYLDEYGDHGYIRQAVYTCLAE